MPLTELPLLPRRPAIRSLIGALLLGVSLLGVSGLPVGCARAAEHERQQYLELRTYHLRSATEWSEVDAYLENGLLPALKRQGIGAVGVFSDKTPEGAPDVYLLIPFDSIAQFAAMQEKLDADKKYQSAAAAYFHTTAKRPRFSRIESELMLSFQAFPRAVVPELRKQGKPRLFELRSYESHSERMGALKVEMFNSGEVPIFLDCGVQPVFMGRVISGPKMPNLTYMTVYADDEALKQAWDRFSDHPDWRTLKAVEKYKGTVSKIHKVLLSPRPYSAF